jgi:hypothetical protein
MAAKKGDWVEIHNIILQPAQRAPQVPDDTRSVPLEMWVKGFITQDARVGEYVEIETVTGRRVKGALTIVNPPYFHSFGNFVPELLKIREQVKSALLGGEK